MQINVKSRAAETDAHPYREKAGENRRRGKIVSVAFLALVSYWALLFAPKAAETLPQRDRPEPDQPMTAPRAGEAELGAVETALRAPEGRDDALPPGNRSAALGRSVGGSADQVAPEVEQGSASADAAAMMAGPQPMGRGEGGAAQPTALATAQGPTALAAGGEGGAVSPSTQPPVAQGPLADTPVEETPVAALPPDPPVESLLPPELTEPVYDLIDLIADLQARTATLPAASTLNLVEFAVNDVLSETALRRLQTGEADLALGRFASEEQAYAELLNRPAMAEPSSFAAPEPAEAAFALAQLAAADMAAAVTPDLIQPAISSF